MSDGLDEVDRMLTRRQALKSGTGALAVALAGCAGDSGEKKTTDGSSENQTPPQTGNNDNSTDDGEPGDDQGDGGLTAGFAQIYGNSTENLEHTEPLYHDQVENLRGVGQPQVFDDTIGYLAQNFNEYPSTQGGFTRSVRHMRAAFLNLLDIGADEARSGLMRTGGNNTFMTHKFKDEVDGEEIVRKMTGWVPNSDLKSLYIPWQDSRDFGDGSFETALRRVWNEDDLTIGSAMAIDTYRTGVFRGETFEEYVIENDNPGTWLSASRALDGQNDFVVYEPEWKERAEWGEIGYGREASNVIRDFMDIHDNQDFTPEWEMEEELTEMYHNEEVVGDPDTFIHVDVTEGGLEDDQRKLTEVDGQVLYAELCGFEQHKKDAYEIAIPDQFYEEGHRYPEGLELPEGKDDGRPAMVDPEVAPLQVDPNTAGNQVWTHG